MVTTTHNYNLISRNTFAMNVKCSAFIEYTAADDIPSILSSIPKNNEWIHIGSGSNLLFTGDYPGSVIHSAIKGIEIIAETQDSIIVRVGGGEIMDDFIIWACDRSLWGIENLSGIPGEAGASAVQNVGAYGTEAADVIVAVHAYDCANNEFVTFDNTSCLYGYRDSLFKHPSHKGRYIIHSIDYRLSPSAGPDLSYPALARTFENVNVDGLTPHDIRRAVIATRDSKLPDPRKVPSAGSFFKNPVISEEEFNALLLKERTDIPHYNVTGGIKIPAAWLIERCGWKGYNEGNVGVWHLQPLVIVNPEKRARPSEVIALEDKIVRSVDERFGIILSPEVEHI